MTQKPPEMPQEIWVNQDAKGTYWLDHNPDPKGEINRSDTRYILAAPKEDVEAALKWVGNNLSSSAALLSDPKVSDETKTILTDNIAVYETIRRVLLANAGLTDLYEAAEKGRG